MITLFRKTESPAADSVQERLRDLVVAHRVVIVGGRSEQEPAPANLPAIRDGDETVSGEAELGRYLTRLERRLREWNRYQSDGCYIGDDGEVC